MRFLFIFLTFTSLLISSEKYADRQKLLAVVAGEWIAHGVYTAAQFDVAGHLWEGSKTVEELAILTGCNEENLYRLLRMLASVDIFHEDEGRHFSNTETSALLAKNHPESLRSLILFYSEEMSQSFDQLPNCIKEGKPAFELTFKQPVFTYFKAHPASGKKFNEAMKEKSQMVINSCLASYDFGKYSKIYDIGGGVGQFISTLLKSNPHMRGLLFEVPGVIKEAQPNLKTFGDRCGLIAGDFFKSVPSDGDAYLLKSVIHDWNDVEALKILKKCYAAMKSGASILLVEPLITSANQEKYAKCMDLYMMAITGSKERTRKDFEELLKQAGFQLESVTQTDTEFAIITAKKM